MAVILGNPIMLGGGGGSKVKKMAISNLAEGDVVRIKEKGVEQDYYLAQHDYQPSLNGSGRVLFVRKNIHSNRVWDAGQVNAYAGSDIDIWLNGDFKGMFDADVREAMGETKFPYTAGNGTTTVSSLERSAFLLSGTELGKSTTYLNTEGAALPIVSKLHPAYLDGTATAQWTRSPCTGNTYVSWVLLTDGTISSGSYTSVSFGVRPCFTLPNTATVLPEANLDGSYTLSLGDDDPNKEYFKLTVVDGTEKPENPAENTIWVNTDIDMGMCYLAPNAPASPEVGDVWVNTTNKYNSNGTNASTNLIRVNDNPYLEINVLNISQWDGSAWVTRENSAIYANGAWTSMALYIFNYGTRNDLLNIKQGFSTGSSRTVTWGDANHFEGDSLFLITDSSEQFGIFTTNEIIDFTPFTKLSAKVKSTESSTQSAISVTSYELSGMTFGNAIDLGNVSFSLGTSVVTAELDISALSVKGRPCIRFYKANVGLYGYVYYWALTA